MERLQEPEVVFHRNSVFQAQQGCYTFELTNLWDHASPEHVQTRQTPALASRSAHTDILLIKKLFAIDSPWEWENPFSMVERRCVYQPHSRANLMPRNSQSMQNYLHGFFSVILFCYYFWSNWFFVCFFFLLRQRKREHNFGWLRR